MGDRLAKLYFTEDDEAEVVRKVPPVSFALGMGAGYDLFQLNWDKLSLFEKW
jgi:hypothetical protein